MSVGKIALGVFLGNLATAIISLIIIAIWTENQRTQNLTDSINAQYEANLERQRAEGSGANAN